MSLEKRGLVRAYLKATAYVCAFCGRTMVKAWNGETPFGNLLVAHICPKCYSTRYLCESKEDPVFKMLEQINEAFRKIYEEEEKRR